MTAKADNYPFYLKELSLENVRAFGPKQTISFTTPDGGISKWNIIMGENGVGKTTMLKSIGLTLGFKHSTSPYFFDHSYYFRTNSVKPKIEILFSNPHTIESKLRLTISDMAIGSNLRFGEECLIIGYGASRRISDSAISLERKGFPAANLFDDNEPLMNAEEWLLQVKYFASTRKGKQYQKQYETVAKILLKLFAGEISAIVEDLESKTPSLLFVTDYGKVKLHQLSLGYKTLIAWTVDVAWRLMERYPDSKDPLAEPAIVLIDEIDLHLHPKMQQNLIAFLTNTFPNVQFIATAHSPLIVQSAAETNLILLKKEGDHVVAQQNPTDIRNWRVDQILTSDLYGLESARPPKTAKLIKHRERLLSKKRLTAEDKDNLRSIESEIGDLPVFETQSEQRAFSAIDKVEALLRKKNLLDDTDK